MGAEGVGPAPGCLIPPEPSRAEPSRGNAAPTLSRPRSSHLPSCTRHFRELAAAQWTIQWPPPSPRPPCELVGHPPYPTPSLWLCSSCTVGIVAENSSRFITPPRQRPFLRCCLTMSRGATGGDITSPTSVTQLSNAAGPSTAETRPAWTGPGRNSRQRCFHLVPFLKRSQVGRGRSWAVIGGHRWQSVAVVSREKFSSHLCAVCRPVRSTAQLNSAKSPP